MPRQMKLPTGMHMGITDITTDGVARSASPGASAAGTRRAQLKSAGSIQRIDADACAIHNRQGKSYVVQETRVTALCRAIS